MIGSSLDIDLSIASFINAWRLFRRGKRCSGATEEFEYNLEDNLLQLRNDILAGAYTHGSYKKFTVNDTKKREIAVATVRDRVVHRLLYEYIVQIVDKRFSYYVWSCRKNKGLLGAISMTQRNMYRYPTSHIWRGDIYKFFDSIDHNIMTEIVRRHIPGIFANLLCSEVVRSHETTDGIGLAIGNLTSQVLGNMYLNEFDRFVLNRLKPLAYVRYGDDFILWCKSKDEAENMMKPGEFFLNHKLNLRLQPAHTFTRPCKNKLHFLGVEIFPSGHRLDKRTAVRIQTLLNQTNVSSYQDIVNKHMRKRHRMRFAWQKLENFNQNFSDL